MSDKETPLSLYKNPTWETIYLRRGLKTGESIVVRTRCHHKANNQLPDKYYNSGQAGGGTLGIKEVSHIKLEVDGRIVDTTFHDANDAWEKAINKIMQGATKAVIVETVTIEKT